MITAEGLFEGSAGSEKLREDRDAGEKKSADFSGSQEEGEIEDEDAGAVAGGSPQFDPYNQKASYKEIP